MATYLQGITDYIPALQPFLPDYNFLSNVLQQRQSKYDSNYNQLSSVYTSLFNSPLTRDENIESKDAFFKTIEQDIKKVSGLDLSLQQNADTASKVFQPFYDNKNLVNDMVWTKQFMNAQNKGESLKGCFDPKKCKGEYWEQGMTKLNYKRDEFKKASTADALGFEKPDYDPYYNWQKEAVDLAIKADLKVTQDVPGGEWIVRKQNGELVQGGLYNLFKSVYGNDPRIDSNNETQAYVNRKNHVANQVSQGINEETAERGYLNEIIANSSKRVQKMADHFNGISTGMGQTATAKQEKAKTKGLTPEEEKDYETLLGRIKNIDNSKNSLDIVKNTITSNSNSDDIRILRQRGDAAAAFELEEGHLFDIAKTMSMRGAEYTLKENPYVMQARRSEDALRNSLLLAETNNKLDIEKLEAGYYINLGILNYKELIKSGALNSGLFNKEGRVIEDDPYSHTFPVAPGSTSPYEDQYSSTVGRIESTTKTASSFVYEAYESAVASAHNGNVAAKKYLKDNFGDKWDDFNSEEDMNKYLKGAKKNINEVFKNTVSSFDATKNKDLPLEWATRFMNGKEEYTHAIKTSMDANAGMVNHIKGINNDIIKTIATQATTGTMILKDANLFLENGLPVSKDKFKVKYDAIYKGKGDYEEAYEKIGTKFYESFNKAKGAVLGRPTDYPGAASKGSASISYEGLSPTAPFDSGFMISRSMVSDLLNDGRFTTFMGQPSKEAVDANKNDEVLKQYISILQNENTNWRRDHKDKDATTAPNFNMFLRGTSGNNKDKSSISFTLLNTPYLKEQIGTTKKPGLLFAYKEQLEKGEPITMVYNNKEVKTPLTDMMRISDVQVQVMTTGIEYKEWGVGGRAFSKYNKGTKMIDTQIYTNYFTADAPPTEMEHPLVHTDPLNYQKYEKNTLIPTLDDAQKRGLQNNINIAAYNKSVNNAKIAKDKVAKAKNAQ